MMYRKRALFAALTLGATALLAPAPVSAQQDEEALRERFMIPLPPTIQVLSTASRATPGSSAGSPSAFGPNWGDGFVGGGIVNRQRYVETGSFRDNVDGSVSAGFGLGNSRDLIGVEVSLASFSTFDSGFGSRGSMSLKLHRVFPGNWGVAVGAENAVTRGPVDSDPSYFAAVSRVWGQNKWNPFNTITATVGAGNGRFQTEDDMIEGANKINPFASIGVHVASPVSVIADWAGQDLTLAASIVPFESIPLIITPGFADVIGTAGDGARFTLGAGMGFQFGSLGRLFP